MQIKDSGHMGFLLEMSERQISAREFFSNVLLDSMDRNFGLKNVLILCFDTEHHFLSWTDGVFAVPFGRNRMYRSLC